MSARQPPGPPALPAVQRLRVHYAKRGRLSFSSHRDFQRAFERALRREAIGAAEVAVLDQGHLGPVGPELVIALIDRRQLAGGRGRHDSDNTEAERSLRVFDRRGCRA